MIKGEKRKKIKFRLASVRERRQTDGGWKHEYCYLCTIKGPENDNGSCRKASCMMIGALRMLAQPPDIPRDVPRTGNPEGVCL
jgi:hypothetical protein